MAENPYEQDPQAPAGGPTGPRPWEYQPFQFDPSNWFGGFSQWYSQRPDLNTPNSGANLQSLLEWQRQGQAIDPMFLQWAQYFGGGDRPGGMPGGPGGGPPGPWGQGGPGGPIGQGGPSPEDPWTGTPTPPWWMTGPWSPQYGDGNNQWINDEMIHAMGPMGLAGAMNSA